MNIDDEKVEQAVLALLYLTLHDGNRAWKGFDFNVLDQLHQKGFTESPINKSKSITLTEQGLSRSKMLFEEMFTK